MDRPRIIIADSDLSYLIPLQHRFIEKFGDSIDFELIDNKFYFEKLFTTPQSAEVLAVSEDLYDSSLRTHNIKHVFILTEQQSEAYTGERNVVRVFKYTNIKDVFNRISGPIVPSEEKRETVLIAVSSAAGGVGKTTIALGLCACLAQSYKKVLYINASRLQTSQHYFENRSPISSQEVYSLLRTPTDSLYNGIRHVIRTEAFSYLPPFKMALVSLGVQYSVFLEIAMQAKSSNDYDYIVVDTDSAFDEDNARLLGSADKVVLVTEQSVASVFATNILAENISGISGEKFYFVCNNFEKEEYNALVSADVEIGFSISEYVEHLYKYDILRIADFTRNSAIQRIAVLVM